MLKYLDVINILLSNDATSQLSEWSQCSLLSFDRVFLHRLIDILERFVGRGRCLFKLYCWILQEESFILMISGMMIDIRWNFWIPDNIKITSPRKQIKAHQLKSSCVIFFFFNSDPIPKMRKPVKKHMIDSPTSKTCQLFKYTERITKNAPSMPMAKKILIAFFSVLK